MPNFTLQPRPATFSAHDPRAEPARLTARCSGRGCYLVLRQGSRSATCRFSVAWGSRAAERER